MLKEIWSSAFIEDGEVRKPIVFHNGLNVVLGGEKGDNSIGKSSLLLVIDFVFGGNAYLKSDAVSHVGNHCIFFTFEFDGKEYHFARNIDAAENIIICNSRYKESNEFWSRECFCNWLKNKYHMENLGLSFRETVSSFFRVYGKENANEWYPLQGIKGRGMKASIEVLVKLYNCYGKVEQLNRALDEQKQKLTTFRDARKFNFLPDAVSTKKQYEDNEYAIKELKNELEMLTVSQDKKTTEMDIEKSSHKAALEAEKRSVESKILSLQRKVKRLDISVEMGIFPSEADLDALQTFFPTVALRKLYEVENYHRKLAGILDKQLLEERQEAQNEITKLSKELESINALINKMGFVSSFSQEFLDKHSEIKSKIRNLQSQNEAFVTQNDLLYARKKADHDLDSALEEILLQIENTINESMLVNNQALYTEKRKPPHLHFNSKNSYTFETPDDKGTGSNFKGMLIYDISVLETSVLPALAHDSFLFKNISDSVITGILNLYKHFDKQIFIALDKQSSFGPEAQRILMSNKVIELGGNSHELYGKSWNKDK